MLEDEGLELLDEAECLALVAGTDIGRVAVSVGALPAVFPVNFGLIGRDVYFRTNAGTKLSAATDHAVVAFQCDHFDRGRHDGWSVQGVGVAAIVTDPADLERVDGLPVEPWIDTPRDHVVKISLEMLTGRRIVRH